MKVSYRWLRSLAPGLDATPGALAERLAGLGFPVEEVEALAEGLGDLVVARVREVRPHPKADRLVLCDVEDGAEVLQVVCGAPNARAGGWYPFAPVGASLPGGMRIGKAKLRGETSFGMLCSEKELGLGRDESGLMELEGAFTAGQSLVEALGLDDVRMDVEVTSNRPDLLSHRGVAREIAPGGVAGVAPPDIPGEHPDTRELVAGLEVVSGESEASANGVAIRIEAPDLCGAYLGLALGGVKVGPSPRWLQTRLRAAGARPINNVVDATNYVLLELGQPLHAFDLERLEDRTIVVRRAAEGEKIRTLDGEERTLSSDILAICDARRPVAVAGVMGGEDSEVGEETTEILLECALFTPGPVRNTRKALGLSTDASYRFERGVDPEGLREAILRAARLILATAGGRVEGPLIEVRPTPFRRATVSLRPSRVEALLGIPFSPERIRELLAPLGFRVREGSPGHDPSPDAGSSAGDASPPGAGSASGGEGRDEVLGVEIPGFRSWDVTREVDLIEEIARTHGYDAFPATLGAFRPGTVPDHPLFLLEDRLREELVARGLLEAHTLAFAPEGEGEVEILNPVSTEERFLRRSLLPGLLRRVEHNLARGNRDVRLFEIGTVFARGPEGELPNEWTHLGVVLHGRRHPPHWSADDEPVDLWDVKGLLEALGRVTADGWAVRPAVPDRKVTDWFAALDPGISFDLVDASGEVRGRGGRIAAATLDLPPWSGGVWGAEISLPSEPEPAGEIRYEPLPLHPGVERDLALLLDQGLAVETALGLIRSEGGEELRDLEVFDLYEGEGIPEGKRSVAVRLHFRVEDRTLKDEDVDARMDHLTNRLAEELGVRIRGRTG
jgi:phenylalanyl-tRNA synthetase beta chain